jgi:organic radical activating enzyme
MKFDIEHLDIPIIRSCNLGCVGCMTFSDHKNIKGIVNLEESIEWLSFWASKLSPRSITLFGGEPLLHPFFVNWAITLRKIWGPLPCLTVNTNGFYIDRIIDQIPELFNPETIHSIIISIQNGNEPYLSKVHENIELLKSKIVEYYLTLPEVKVAYWDLWLDENTTNKKQWFNLVINGQKSKLGLTVCEMYKLHWVPHYNGSGPTLKPVYDYHDEWFQENHSHCQTKKFLTLYKGILYKCPPIGVLEHTLETFGLKDTAEWKPYLDNYQYLSAYSSDVQISDWIKTQQNPELVCNMCGFSGPNNHTINRSHLMKMNWKYNF